MKKKFDTATRTFVFTFEGDVAPVALRLDDISAECREHATVHGMLARLGDTAAISRTEANGFTVTEAMRRAAVAELAGHYASGAKEWNVRTAAPRASSVNATIAATAVKRGCTYAEAEVWLAKLADDAIAAMAAGE